VNVAVSQPVDLWLGTTLELRAAAGVLLGDSESFRLPSGDLYRKAHDGSVRATLLVPVGPLSMAPMVEYVFPLSTDARTALSVDDALVVGTTLSLDLGF
jgi:hypothetical protein